VDESKNLQAEGILEIEESAVALAGGELTV
jgi:hypothetical protein